MIEVTLFIPLADNEGQTFSAEAFDSFETFATTLFGGATRLDSLATGLWSEAGVTYRDRSTVYVVALKSLTEGGKVAQLAEYAKAHFRQLAIYVRYLGIAEIL